MTLTRYRRAGRDRQFTAFLKQSGDSWRTYIDRIYVGALGSEAAAQRLVSRVNRSNGRPSAHEGARGR